MGKVKPLMFGATPDLSKESLCFTALPVSLDTQRENPFRKEISPVRLKMAGSDYGNSLLSVMQI